MHATSPPSGARRLMAVSIVARLPLAMIDIGLLVHARRLTGSFALAGVVVGAHAIALGLTGPMLGRLVDRRGQTLVLLTAACFGAVVLLVIALLPVHGPLAVLIALSAGAGLATPPVGACLRSQLPAQLNDAGATRRAFALEASLVELTYILGPALVLTIGAILSSGVALVAAAFGLLVATVAFAAQPGSRNWRPTVGKRPRRVGSLVSPQMQTLTIILSAVGALLGADEVAVIAVTKSLHSPGSAAPLFAVWGVGSFIGGLLLARLGGGARTAAALALLLAGLTVGHLALIPADGSVLALGAVLILAGAAIAPTEATIYAMVDGATPEGSATEAFAWLTTAMAVGGAVGAAGAGLFADHGGPAAAFGFAGSAGAVAILACLLRSGSFTTHASVSYADSVWP